MTRMAKSLEQAYEDLLAAGYSSASARNWLVNKYPQVKVDALIAKRTKGRDAVTREDRIRALRKIEPHAYQTPKYGSANLPCLKCGLNVEAPEHRTAAKDSDPRRARLHRALDRVLDAHDGGRAKDEARMIARWESKTGKYWVDLYFNPAFKLANGQVIVDAHYRAPGAGGGVQASTEAEAIAAMQRRIDQGGFQPDAAKTSMRRVR